MSLTKPVTQIYRYNDHAKINFTGTETSYTAGANAGTKWPTGERAKRTLLLSTENVYVRFDGKDAVQQEILTGNFFEWKQLWSIIYVQRITVNGTLYCWIEG